jgi:hypothetical protein
MIVAVEPWRVRVSRTDGRICGAGVLIDRLRVLTCAHVVAQALGVDLRGGTPTGTIRVEFPSLGGVSRLATVAADGWVPMAPDGRGDVAVLVLDEPAPPRLVPAGLARCGPLENRMVRAYGHPVGIDDGVWAVTKLVGFGGPSGEWVQIDGQTVTGRRVEGGFSGAGAIDDRSGAVVGLIVAEDAQAANKVAWMIPMELVAAYLPFLAGLLAPGPEPAPAAPVVPQQRPAGSVPERRLTQAEQRELFERLWAVPDMPDRSARDLYISAVEQHMGEALSFPRQHLDLLDGWALTYALVSRPGAVRAMVAVLIEIHRSNEQVAGAGGAGNADRGGESRHGRGGLPQRDLVAGRGRGGRAGGRGSGDPPAGVLRPVAWWAAAPVARVRRRSRSQDRRADLGHHAPLDRRGRRPAGAGPGGAAPTVHGG